jgi:hypothetical protein
MGCTGSKPDVKSQNPLEFTPKEINDTRPDAVRREITELYKSYSAKRDRIKPLLAEKYGIQAMIDGERIGSISRVEEKEKLFNERQPLLDATWEHDADDLNKAFQKFSTDKSVLVTILCARAYWQINEIAKVYERKYNAPLLEKVVNELTTMLGSLLTGAGTGLSKLLTYRIMPQPERDAAMLKDCLDGMSVDDAGLMEILCTRSNVDLRQAIFAFNQVYKRDLIELIRSKCTQKNYRDFVMKILDCNRDEDNIPFDPVTAKAYADELYKAGAARSFGFEPEPFIRILVNINHTQFESINNQYPNRQLLKDIQAKLGGDFQLAVMTRCTEKYEYFANRIETALRGYISSDTDTLCRILGCLSRPDCVRVKLAYNRSGFKRTLDEAVRAALKSQSTYQNACLMLISEDTSVTPTGSDKEISEEENELAREAEKLANNEFASYNAEATQKRGEDIMAEKRRSWDSGNRDPQLEEEDRLLSFAWDGKGRFLDLAKLNTTFRELETADNQLAMMVDTLPDQMDAQKMIYKTLLKHRYETEGYVRTYQRHIQALKDFSARRDKVMKDTSQTIKRK